MKIDNKDRSTVLHALIVTEPFKKHSFSYVSSTAAGPGDTMGISVGPKPIQIFENHSFF